ncbi:MAG: hypothetical protein IJH39_02190 [Clostridia bacterium]|nr:hypothetical protein [Clostridia bacterium]
MKSAIKELLKYLLKLSAVIAAFGVICAVSPAASAAVAIMIIIYFAIIKP